MVRVATPAISRPINQLVNHGEPWILHQWSTNEYDPPINDSRSLYHWLIWLIPGYNRDEHRISPKLTESDHQPSLFTSLFVAYKQPTGPRPTPWRNISTGPQPLGVSEPQIFLEPLHWPTHATYASWPPWMTSHQWSTGWNYSGWWSLWRNYG